MSNPKIQVILLWKKFYLNFWIIHSNFILQSKNLNKFSNYVIQISFRKNFIRISDSFKLKFIQFLIQLIMSFKLVLEKII